VILTIVPPVDDFGLGNGGGSRDIAAAWFYRLAAECASGRSLRSKIAAMPRRGPNLASLLSAQWRYRHGRQNGAGLIKPLTMIKRSLPTGFSLICQTDRIPAGGAAWGFFGESLNERAMTAHALPRVPKIMSERSTLSTRW
jgi:hypothetical protein